MHRKIFVSVIGFCIAKKRMRPDQKILTRPLYVKSDYFKGEFGSFFI